MAIAASRTTHVSLLFLVVTLGNRDIGLVDTQSTASGAIRNSSTDAKQKTSSSGVIQSACKDDMAENLGEAGSCVYSCASLRAQHKLPKARCIFIKANTSPSLLEYSNATWPPLNHTQNVSIAPKRWADGIHPTQSVMAMVIMANAEAIVCEGHDVIIQGIDYPMYTGTIRVTHSATVVVQGIRVTSRAVAMGGMLRRAKQRASPSYRFLAH